MRIKSLRVNGFKSFVDRTVFGFEPGITAVVGPNGCGKSNVVDAIRWAMGEQAPRRLRGKSMEDVIFAGSEALAPVGLAEVTLTFDNADRLAPPGYGEFSEIQVTRRLYRSGESEYLINKTAVRLRDVLDFFRDTGVGTRGYTIVEQGQIAAIVSAKPDERRVLIEEAAGISKYKARRREAERKLAATEQNLLRASDVLGEIRRQLGSIERQARKAARYKRLRERLRILELSLAADARRALLAEIEADRQRLVERRQGVTVAEARVAEREAALEQARLELVEREKAVVSGSEALFALRSEIKELESRSAYETRARASLAETRTLRGEELERLRGRLAAAEAEARAAAAELESMAADFAREDEALKAAEREASAAREAQRTLESQREQLNTALLSALTEVARGEDRLAALDQRRDGLQRRLRSADEALEVQQGEATRFDDEQRNLVHGLHNLLAERDRLMGALRTALERHERALAQSREHLAEELSRAREAREKRHARLDSLRELLERGEDLVAGTRHLLAQGEAVRSAHGLRALVRDVLEVEPEAERAVEAVLAERAEAWVAERPEGALAALDLLRAADAGRAVFVCDPQGGAPLGLVPLGEPLLDRVRPRPGFEAVARTLLGGVYLVQDLREALRHFGAGRLPAHFVTRAGDMLSPDGVVRGGRTGTVGALGRVRELRDLERETAELDRRVAELERQAAEGERVVHQAADEVDNLRNRHHTAALAVANHEKDLERTRERVKALGEAQEGRAAERSELVSEAEALIEERTRVEARLVEGRHGRLELSGRLETLAGRIGAATREAQRYELALAERRVSHVARAEKRDRLAESRRRSELAAEEAREWIARREREIQEIDAQREALAASVQQAETSLAEKLRREEAARVAADSARNDYEVEAEAIRAREAEVRGQRSEVLAAREELQAGELSLREAELRLENLDGQIRERWSVELGAWSPPTPEQAAAAAAAAAGADGEDEEAESVGPGEAELAGLPAEERHSLLGETRRRLDALGEVNLAAIEEHEELGERFRFLSEQKSDLERTIASLREAIARINRTSRKRFRETFEAVNERFKANFPRLFRGGKASLALTEAEDVLEAGIDILAQPPGKRLQNVNLLSGGEKTLTALALLVSLFQVHPSPFFLLDEVDAALDDVNVGRFNEIVQEMAKESQFLLITHNKQTIEIADRLYGVTMEQKGVSKLVSVELKQP